MNGRTGQRLAWGTDTRGWLLSRGSAGNRAASDSAWAPGWAQQEGCVCPLHLRLPSTPLLGPHRSLASWTPPRGSGRGGPSGQPALGWRLAWLIYLFSLETVLRSPHNLWAEDTADK